MTTRATGPPSPLPSPGGRGGKRPRRIVSLLASATETVAALGAGDRLVARSHECDFPPGLVAPLPVVTAPKVPEDLIAHGSSRAIDAEVRRLVELGLSVYRVDAERLRALEPDLIVTQDQCRVCAVSLDDVRRAVADLLARPAVEVVSLSPRTLGDIFEDVRRVARACAREEAGEVLVRSLEGRVEGVRARATPSPRPSRPRARLRARQPALPAAARLAAGPGPPRGRGRAGRPRVLFIDWIDPLMGGGSWMAELIEIAGGEPVLQAPPGGLAPRISVEDARAARADLAVIAPCGFALERGLAEARALAPALGAARVVVANGNAYFNRSGPRIVDSLELLQGIIFEEPTPYDDARTQLLP